MTIPHSDLCARKMLQQLSTSALVDAGFCNKGLTWNRKVDEIIRVFDFQVHRESGESTSKVTVNLGLCSPHVWSLVWNLERPSIYKETDCCPRFRVGYLLSGQEPNFRDVWWTIEDGDFPATRELIDIVVDECIPYLNSHNDLDAMETIAVKFMDKMAFADKIYLATIEHLLDQNDQRDVIFSQLLSNPRVNSWRGRIEGILERLGLDAETLGSG